MESGAPCVTVTLTSEKPTSSAGQWAMAALVEYQLEHLMEGALARYTTLT